MAKKKTFDKNDQVPRGTPVDNFDAPEDQPAPAELKAKSDKDLKDHPKFDKFKKGNA